MCINCTQKFIPSLVKNSHVCIKSNCFVFLSYIQVGVLYCFSCLCEKKKQKKKNKSLFGSQLNTISISERPEAFYLCSVKVGWPRPTV